MLKFLLVLLVVGIVLWSLLSRLRGPGRRGGDDGGGGDGVGDGGGDSAGRDDSGKPAVAAPVVMVECAHCGLHLPAADAVPEDSQLYCSDAHRRLGPVQPPQA